MAEPDVWQGRFALMTLTVTVGTDRSDGPPSSRPHHSQRATARDRMRGGHGRSPRQRDIRNYALHTGAASPSPASRCRFSASPVRRRLAPV